MYKPELCWRRIWWISQSSLPDPLSGQLAHRFLVRPHGQKRSALIVI